MQSLSEILPIRLGVPSEEKLRVSITVCTRKDQYESRSTRVTPLGCTVVHRDYCWEMSLRWYLRKNIRADDMLRHLRAASILPVNSATRALIRATRDSMAADMLVLLFMCCTRGTLTFFTTRFTVVGCSRACSAACMLLRCLCRSLGCIPSNLCPSVGSTDLLR